MESSVWGITMILLKNIYYEWEDGRTALKNVNLEIRKGEFVLISRLIFFKAVRPSSHA